jgi:hypothetical protein
VRGHHADSVIGGSGVHGAQKARRARTRLHRWRGLLTANVEDGRDLLRQVLESPASFTPNSERPRVSLRGRGRIRAAPFWNCGTCTFYGVPNGN